MFKYIKSLILANTPERVSAFLAVLAGISLCIGFFIILFLISFGKVMSAELAIISAGLVSLATFTKIDRNIEQIK